MRKILIRSGMSPLENIDPAKVMVNNLIGSNSGNLVYQYAIYRHLLLEDTDLIPTRYNHKYSNSEIDDINKHYEAFIIPLADAFRESFVPHLKTLTKLVNRLKIPCIVVGVGFRSSYEPTLDEENSFDEDVKAFMNAVLNKSNIVGIRGEITGKYLTRLGFKEGNDFMLIGCPSMYTFGGKLNIQKPDLSNESKITINFSPGKRKKIQKYMQKELLNYNNRFFIPQNLSDLKLLYTGVKYEDTGKDRGYPYEIENEIYNEDKARFFVNFPSWKDFMSDTDLSFGTRLHGSIAAIITGKPAVLITSDSRTRELASYHGIPFIASNDFDYKKNILEYAQNMNLDISADVQNKNFKNYVDFLEKNGIPNIYSNEEESKLDNIVVNNTYELPVRAISSCNSNELRYRMKALTEEMTRNNDELKEYIDDIESHVTVKTFMRRKIKKVISKN